MSRARRIPLTHAFETTDYCVHVGDEYHQINIGAPCPDALRHWLAEHGQHICAWQITAHNPQAQRYSTGANTRRATALKTWLDAAGHTYVDANSRARDGGWPTEPGVCIIDMDEGQARALALRFGQLAIVAIPRDGPVQLLWLDDEDNCD